MFPHCLLVVVIVCFSTCNFDIIVNEGHPKWFSENLKGWNEINIYVYTCIKSKCDTTENKNSICLNYVLLWPLYRSVGEAASFPGHVCLNMWKEWINETPMAEVIHAKRTTLRTVRASTQIQIPSSLLLCVCVCVCVQAERRWTTERGRDRQVWVYVSVYVYVGAEIYV